MAQPGVIEALNAYDFPGLGSNKYRKCPGYRRQYSSTRSRVRSRELLSTTITSHSVPCDSRDEARLSSALSSVSQRLQVHKIAVIFMLLDSPALVEALASVEPRFRNVSQ